MFTVNCSSCIDASERIPPMIPMLGQARFWMYEGHSDGL